MFGLTLVIVIHRLARMEIVVGRNIVAGFVQDCYPALINSAIKGDELRSHGRFAAARGILYPLRLS